MQGGISDPTDGEGAMLLLGAEKAIGVFESGVQVCVCMCVGGRGVLGGVQLLIFNVPRPGAFY